MDLRTGFFYRVLIVSLCIGLALSAPSTESPSSTTSRTPTVNATASSSTVSVNGSVASSGSTSTSRPTSMSSSSSRPTSVTPSSSTAMPQMVPKNRTVFKLEKDEVIIINGMCGPDGCVVEEDIYQSMGSKPKGAKSSRT